MSLNIKTETGREMLASLGGNVINGAEMQHYSEEERIVGYWVDGRPIYRKVYTNISYSSGQFFSISDNALKGTIPIRICGRARINFGGTAYRWVDMPSSQCASSDTDKFLLGSPFLNTESGQLYCYPIYLTNFSKFDNVMFIVEYTKPTDTPITNNNTYSTDEVLTGKTDWAGRPIYRKVFNVNSPNIADQNTNVITPTDFNFDVIDEIVNIYGKLLVIVGNNEFVYPLNMYIYNGVSVSCWYRGKNNGIGMNIHGNTDLLNKPATIILEYTKTTD